MCAISMPVPYSGLCVLGVGHRELLETSLMRTVPTVPATKVVHIQDYLVT